MKSVKKLLAAVALGALVLTTAACGQVPNGYEGVIVDNMGGGVDSKEAGVGYVFYGWGKDLYTFPVRTQTVKWEHNNNGDESISFQDKDGLVLNADIGFTYFVQKGRSSEVFSKYGKPIEEITDTFVRNMVRDALVRHSSQMSAEEAYSTKKNELLDVVQADIVKQMEPIGITVEEISWLGPIRLPKAVQDSINAKIQATQIAMQRENEVAQTKAEAQKKIEEARGDAESTRLRAEAEANALDLRGEAIKRNPAVAQLNWIEKWNGVLPVTVLGADSNIMYVPK